MSVNQSQQNRACGAVELALNQSCRTCCADTGICRLAVVGQHLAALSDGAVITAGSCRNRGRAGQT